MLKTSSSPPSPTLFHIFKTTKYDAKTKDQIEKRGSKSG